MPQVLGLNTVVVAASGQVSARLGDDDLILNLETGIYHGLNKVGALVWSLIKEPQTVANLHEAILEAYDVDSDRCLNDLMALLGQLQDARLIEIRDA